MPQTLEMLLTQFLEKTKELKVLIGSYKEESEDDVEKWVVLLEERQEIINQIDKLLEQGHMLSDEQKQNYLSTALLIDEEVKPMLQKHMTEIQAHLTGIMKKKSASLQYSGYTAPEAYGAFFDKRK